MNHGIVFLCCLAAFWALAFGTLRVQEDFWGRALARMATRCLRVLGASLLLLALWWLVDRQGWGLGLVMFSGHTSLAAGCVFCGLIVRERSGAHD